VIKADRLLTEMFAVKEATSTDQAQKELDGATSLVRRPTGPSKPNPKFGGVQRDLDSSRSVAKREATLNVPDKDMPPLKKVVKAAIAAKQLPDTAKSYFPKAADTAATADEPKTAKTGGDGDAAARYDAWLKGKKGGAPATASPNADKPASSSALPDGDVPFDDRTAGRKLPAPKSAATKVKGGGASPGAAWMGSDAAPKKGAPTDDGEYKSPFSKVGVQDTEPPDVDASNLMSYFSQAKQMDPSIPKTSKRFTPSNSDVQAGNAWSAMGNGSTDKDSPKGAQPTPAAPKKKQSALSKIFKGRRDDGI